MPTEDTNTPAAPDTNPTDVQPDDTGASQVADGGDATTPPAAELDAFSAGVEAAREQEAKEDALPGEATPPADGQPPPQEGDGAPPVTPDPNAPPNPPEGEQQPPTPPTVDEEVKQLGLKERAAERFQELHSQARAGAEARERVGQWEQTVASTGATPEQYGQTLRYLSDINSGDPKRMGEAYERMQGELQWLGKQLGREAPGFDPLTAHADLAGKVGSGDLSRDAALEIARYRQNDQLQASNVQAQQQRYQQQLESTQGLAQVQQLGQTLRASDPAFEQKMAMLAPTLGLIQNNLAPAQWAAALHQAYQELPAVPAPPAVAAAPVQRSAPNPIRPSGGAPVAPQVTPENAFDIGVQIARERGL